VSYQWENTQVPVVLSDLKLLQYDMKLPLKYSNGSENRWGRKGKFSVNSEYFSDLFSM
jgi:hypothetical protein